MKHSAKKPTILSRSIAFALSLPIIASTSQQASAVTYYWDTNAAAGFGSVTGAWNGTNAFWNTDITGAITGTFTASPTTADDLILSAGTAGTITLTGTRIGSSLTLSDNVANTITGGTLQLGGTGTSSGLFLTSAITTAQVVSSAITLNAASTIQNAGTGLLTVSSGITGAFNLTLQNNGATANGVTISSINNGGSVTNSGTGTGSTLITGIIGSAVTGGVIQNSATSQLILRGANTFTGGLSIKAGTVVINTAAATNALSSGTVTIGEAASAAAATLSFSGSGAFPTFTNALTINGTGTSLIHVTGFNPVLNGAMTLNNNLTISSNNASGSTLTFGGGVTGTGNITVSLNNTSNASLVTFGTAAVNNTGTLTFNNAAVTAAGVTGVAGTGTGTNLITGGVGANVTAITQGSNSNPLTISTTAITVGGSNKVFNSTGSALFTISGGVTGAGNVTFNANSTGGITVSTTALNNTGTVTNSGTNSGLTTISSVIGTAVTGVTQNSATSQLTLSNAANTYTGPTTITQGTLNVGNVVVATGASGLGNATSNIILGGVSTLGTLNYTGAAATMTRPFTINAGGGQINSTTAVLTLTPASGSIITGTGPITFGGANGITVGSTTYPSILMPSVTAITKVGAGTTTWTAAINVGHVTKTSSIPINIQQGTLVVTQTGTAGASSNILGTGTITITPGATLTFQSGGGVSVLTFANPINVASGSGTATINGNTGGVTNNQAITFQAGSTAATILRFGNTNTVSITDTWGGAISGTGTIQINATGLNGSPITLSGAQNQTGSITNLGATAANTSVSTLSGAIGANLTGISQAGTNPFTVSHTNGVPLSAAMNTFTSTGSGLWSFTGATNTFTGTQPLTFNANSTGGITVSGANLNHTGTVTNSGTSFGTTTISSAVGVNVGDIIQNSPTSALVLSGTNSAYTGIYTISNGLMQFSSTAAMTGFTGTPNANVKIAVASGGILGLSYPTFTEANVTDLVSNAGGTYTNVSFAATGASIGLDTTAGSNTFSSVLANAAGTTSFGLVKLGTNTLTLGTANTFSGPVSIRNGTLSAGILNSVAAPAPVGASSLGVPTSAANGTISLGFGTTTGTLSYTGAGETTDRVINLAGTTGGAAIDQSGTGLLQFTGNMTFTGTGTKALTLSGSTAGTGEISGTIAGSFSNTGTASTTPFTINKTGTGTWTLSGTGNTASTVTISGGILDTGVNGLTLGNVGAATIAATANSTINGKLILVGITTAGNGADFGATTAGVTLTINALISGADTTDIDFWSQPTGVTILNGLNTYAGQSNVAGQTVQVTSLDYITAGTYSNHGLGSSLGAPITVAKGTIAFGNTTSAGTLRYVGSGETTDRVLNLQGTTGGGTIEQSGTGLLKFTSANTATGVGIKTLTLQGSTAGTGEIAGAIVNSTATTAITKAGTGTWTLSGANTYTGATTVNGGNLILGPTGSLANTGIVINSGGTLSPRAGFTVGNTATAAAGGSLTLNALGLLNLADGTIGNFNLVQNTTFAGNAATFAGGAIAFDIGSSLGSNDQIDVRLNDVTGTGLATSSGGTGIAIAPGTGVLSLANGAYTLIKAAGTLSGSNFYLASPNLLLDGTLYNLSLSLVGTNEVLTVATGGAAVAPNTAFWNGTTSTDWALGSANGVATNWVSTATGAADTYAVPASNSNVIMTSNSATNLATALNQAFTINSLTFTGNAANAAGSSIASGTGGAASTLTINAAALNGNVAGNGITVLAGSGANTISAPVILGGNQTWTNNSANPLTFSGDISGTGLTLTTVGTGSIQIGNGGTTGSIATDVVLVNNGNLAFNRSNTLTFPNAISGTGNVTQSGAGTLVLSGTNTYTGNTVVSGGTLNITGSITGNGTTTNLAYGGTAGNTIVNISGSVNNYKNFTGANVAGSIAVMNQTGGSASTLGTGGGDTQWVAQNGGYGYLNITGGTFNTGRFDAVGITGGGTAVVYVGGAGTFNNSSSDWLILPRTNGTGTLTVGPGGNLVRTAAVTAQLAITMDGTNSHGALNIAGGNVDTGVRAIQFGFGGSAASTGNRGFVNLAGGTLSVGLAINQTNTAGQYFDHFNFAGGTLKSNAAITWLPAASVAGHTLTATIYGAVTNNNNANAAFNTQIGTTSNFGGGLTVDTNGFATTSAFPLSGATGVGVTQADIGDVSLLVGNSGYIGAPAVVFSAPAAPGGVPASGYAVIDVGTGKVNGIVITNPGNYAASETPTITLSGGGGTIAAFATTALATANTSGGLTKLGLGTLTLTGVNTYTGGTTVTGGTLALGAAGVLADAGNVTINGGTFDAATFAETVATVSLQSGSITGSTGVLTSTVPFDLRSGTVSFTGAGGLGGAVAANKTTAGTVTLTSNGLGAFANVVNVDGGTLAFSASNQLGSAAASNTIGINGGTLSYTGATPVDLTATRVVTIGVSHGTIDTSNPLGALTLTGGVNSTNNNLTKTGPGSLILSGTSNLGTGSVAVDAGALIVNTTLTSSATTVASAATLGGTGTMTSSVTISSGGMLSPATSTTGGTLTIGSLTLNAGSLLAYEFGGGTNDLVSVTTASGLTLNGGALSLYAAGGVNPLIANGTYDLFTYSIAFGGLLSNLTVSNSQGGKTYSINDTGSIIQLVLGTAVSSDWSGTNGDGSWTTDGVGGNWNGGVQPDSLGAVANFGSLATTPQTVTLNGGKTVGSIIFNNANSFTIGTNTDAITLNNGIAAGAISATTGSHTINAPIALNGNANITPGASTGITFGGIISGIGRSLTFSGAGASTLNAANTYSGGTTLSAGTLNLGNDAALGGGPLTISAGTTIDNTKGSLLTSANNNAQNWNGSFTFTGTESMNLGTGAVTLGASPTITTGTVAKVLTVGGAIDDGVFTFGITKAGPGTLVLNGNNGYDGLTTVNAGVLTLAGNNSGASGGVTLTAGLLNINSDNALGTGRLTLSGGTIDNTDAVAHTQAGNPQQTWTNAADVPFTGTRALNLGAGAVTLGTDATTGSFTLTNNSVLVGTSLTVGGDISAIAGGTAGVKTLTIAGPGSTALTGSITKGSASNVVVTVTSGGTTTLSGAASSIQTININGGASSILDLGAGNLTITNGGTNGFRSSTGGTINATGGGKIILGSDLLDNGTADGTTLTVNAAITGPFTFEIYGGTATNTGVTVLTAQNTFTGRVDINGGNLSVSNIGNTGSTTSNLGSGTTIQSGAAVLAGNTVTTGKLIYTGAGETTNRILSLNGAGFAIEQAATSGNLLFSANLSVPNTAAKTLFLLGSTAGTGELGGVIPNNTAATSITKLGSGTWTLSGVNTYTGVTTVSNGVLTLSGNRTVAATGGFSVGNVTGSTGTLEVTNGTFTVGAAGSNFLVGNGTASTGIMNQSGGSLTTIGNQLLIGNGTATGTYNLSGGTLTTIAGTLGVTIGVNTGTTGTFNLSSTGTLTMPATSTLQITRSDNSAATGVTGTFNQTGGTATVGILQMGGSNTTPANNDGANATLNLTGGTFTATTFGVLSGANNSTSTINIGGTAQVTLPVFPTNVKGTGATASITFDSGATGFLSPAAASATYLPAGTFNNAYLTANGAKFNVPTTRDITVAQVLQDAVSPAAAGTLTKSGVGALTLSGANTYTGATAIKVGALSINTIANVGAASSAIGAPTTVGNGLIAMGNAATTGTLIYTGAVQSTDRTIQIGTNSTTPANTDTGGATIQADGATNAALTFSAATFNTQTNATTGVGATRTLTLQGASTGANTISGTIQDNLVSGAGTGTATVGLTKAGAGLWILSGTNTYTGATNVTVGELRISSATALNGTSGIAVTSGAMLALDGGITVGTGKTITINGSGIGFAGALSTSSGNNEWAGNVTIGSASARIGNLGAAAGDLKISGVIDSGVNVFGPLFRTGIAGTSITLSGASTYLGDTTFATTSGGGSVILSGGSNRLPITTKLIIGVTTVPGVLNLNGQNQEVAGISVGQASGTFSNEVKSTAAATLTVNTAAASPSSYSGTITGGISLVKKGADTLTLTGSNTFSGATTVSAGTLSLGNSLAMQNSPLDTLNSVAGDAANGLKTSLTTLTMGGLIGDKDLGGVFTTASGGYSGLTALTLNPGTGAIDSYSADIGDGNLGINLIKTGLGTQGLSGTNTYTGTTTINAGTLVVSGSISGSAVTVNTGGTLGGTGTTGALTVNTGGTVSPGLSPGQLNTGAFTLNTGASLALEVNATGAGNYDVLNVTGGVTLGGTLSLSGSYLTTPSVTNDLFFAIINDGSDAITGTFAGLADGSHVYAPNGQDYFVSYFGDSVGGTVTGGNDFVLQAVPEPGSAVLVLGGLIVLGASRRRKQA